MERQSKSQAEWVLTRTAEQTRTTGEPTVNGQPIYTAKTPDGQTYAGTMMECCEWAESIGADDVRIEKVKG